MVQHLAKETWDFFKVMYEHVNRSMRVVVKKKSTTLIMQKGESTTSFLEKFQDLLSQMACVGLVVNDQDAMMQLLGALLASYKIFVIIVGNMLCTY
jgi:phosphatidylinositol kinase/protein kinase (PI-3  family)